MRLTLFLQDSEHAQKAGERDQSKAPKLASNLFVPTQLPHLEHGIVEYAGELHHQPFRPGVLQCQICMPAPCNGFRRSEDSLLDQRM